MQTSGSCSCCCSSALSAPWLSLLHEPPTQQNNCTFRWLRSSSTTGKKLESQAPVKREKTVGYSCWYLVPIRAMRNSPLPSLPAGPPGAAGSPSAHTAPGTAGRAAPWLRPGHAHIWPHTGTPALPGSVTAVGETIRNTHTHTICVCTGGESLGLDTHTECSTGAATSSCPHLSLQLQPQTPSWPEGLAKISDLLAYF